MVKVHVTFGLGLDVPQREITVEMMGDANIADLFDLLRREHKMKNALTMKVPGFRDFTPRLIVLLNGRNINHLDGEQLLLFDGDQVKILAMLAGG